jgi:branched-chain amino acid aminotransferase
MPPYSYFKKQFMPLEDAKIGILTHALHYGTACFDGIRGQWDDEKGQMFLFRVRDHYKRLLQGCKLLKIHLPYTLDDFMQITVELVERSGYQEDVYIRPLAYKSSEAIGVRLHELEDDFLAVIATLPAYLDAESGVRCCTSSWRRVDDNMIPARGKITGIYVNSALAKTEANLRGFDEAILLTHDGHIAEGSGENIFIVHDGKLITPPGNENILLGITRDTVITLAKNELGLETIERSIDRSEIYLADEAFFTGTAAHVSPIIELDEREVGEGKTGEITSKLQKLYFDIINGKNPKYLHWCTVVSPELAKTREK